MNRRTFLATSLATTAALGAGCTRPASRALPEPNAARLPRWRGFNLLAKFNAGKPTAFREKDFELMQEWGFNFARLPMSYHCWSKPDPAVWTQMDEAQLRDVDQAVAWGKSHNVHVNLNMHRVPGYCVNPPAEPLDLWHDDRALQAACAHWRHFATRYQGIPNQQLSFDLINEPPAIAEADYARVIRALVAAIRAVDPNRLIIADGLRWGTTPVHSLADLNVAQSTRGYNPMPISHFRASWVKGSDTWAIPEWPLKSANALIDKDYLRKNFIQPWQALQDKRVGVHVGEWGAFNKTPHDVALRWMEDNLQLWQEAGWGWSLWNLDGAFGILNSGRTDVAYEEFRGEKLDRKMLELLRKY
ncbi:MAG: cellulase family glycosylhydrolase [Cytophagaceae bacterium]|nr:cellulase family glycosylhydrolase [Cytophagaceae bacterium]